ncbi:hypothetical protein ANI02nite_34890 [Acetobacter nitrogenifigens DSM 23921 = NBRC 105050]|uniref:Uncharacterized protein n=1 Tax=Acetobacter nitrogenifigens DSM 23921 = NBRC 105050 TaxID=1120919 RepID=A0A511XFB9_9PROT|nr:hypothetical protein ANI02nite_34890 [Acetobacter nitrogenifigens DSM 23921 = NBRC 105050]
MGGTFQVGHSRFAPSILGWNRRSCVPPRKHEGRSAGQTLLKQPVNSADTTLRTKRYIGAASPGCPAGQFGDGRSQLIFGQTQKLR